MLRKRLLVAGAAFGLGLSVGVGGLIAASAKDDLGGPATLEAFASGDYAQELEAPKTLGNGQTAGSYRTETPVDERPDFIEVRLDSGTTAYVKLADTFAPPVIPVGETGPRKISEQEMAEMMAPYEALEARADSNGEIWVDAYAEDGTTVIGKWLAGTV